MPTGFVLNLPTDFPYVLATATAATFVNIYHVMLTGGARRKAGVKYPAAYATDEQAAKNPDAAKFNCAQRAHANFTENLTPFLTALVISGLRFPLVASGIGASWVISRVLYARGYVAHGPEGRKGGGGHFIATALLELLAAYTSASMVWSISKPY